MQASPDSHCRAFIYARCSSSRLPGKVLMSLDGRSPLKIILDKLATLAIEAVIVTSTDSTDDRLEDWCRAESVACFRGDLENVAQRTVAALTQYPCDYFFRINGDSPFLQEALLGRSLEALSKSPSVPDLVTNLIERSYPYGIAVELINAETFKKCVPAFTKSEREHITSYFYSQLKKFTTISIVGEEDYSDARLVLDTQADFNSIQQLLTSRPDLFSLGTADLYHLTQNSL